MKKLFLLATAALLVTGVSFAHSGDGKKCGKGDKECCKKAAKDGKECCKKEDKKEVKKEDKKVTKPAAKA
ncbi:MAG: hypothetical protein K2X37_00345 [Chitinophagaceae bacterium]|jgi:hypothetical protein|nr:hypothetical protein [Chitinophagaceae bacterium]